ncbi:MAG: ABC transporter permease [Bacteroidaceae bacterium]|nr:ABC transporter permease [Bacteroidaceae bacterium]
MTWFINIFKVWYNELKEISRDEGIMVFILLVPLAYPLLYAFIYTTETQHNLPVCVVDQCQSSLTREFIRKVDATPEVKIAGHALNMAEAQEMLRMREVSGIIQIPHSFDRDLAHGKQVVVGVFSDLTSMLYYKVMLLGVTNVAQDMNRDIKVQNYLHPGTRREEEVARMPIDFEHVQLYNTQGGFSAFLIPPVLMLILQQTLFLGIGMSMGRTRENNRGLVIPPQSGYKHVVSVVLGKSMLYFFLYLVMAVYMNVVISHFFGLPQLMHWNVFFGFMVPYLLACIFLGFCFSAFIFRREDCILLFVFMSVPLLFLTGVSWPGSAIPKIWQWIAVIFPSTFGCNAYIRAGSMGATLGDINHEVMAMWYQAGIYFLLACLIYIWEIRRAVGRTILK